MADIFLSYTHNDKERARPIVELLEDEGWSVWWDRGIEPGMKWLPELENELANCRAIIVLWTNNSMKSEWVHKEADAGLAKKALVPIVLDIDTIPKKYAQHQATDLRNWRGSKDLTEIQSLLRRLAGLVPPSRIDTVRPGYDSKFLGDQQEIILPGVTGSAVVLRYNHFTVVMNPARRLAHYTAYNVDGNQFVELERPDKWTSDPMLPDSLQIELSLLRMSSYDRGHIASTKLLRWGEKRSASISARQTFYWTNIAPQHQKLNRFWWLKLEQLEGKAAKTYGRITGFSGPIFSENDEPFRGELKLEDGLIALDTFRVPRAYWKVIIAVLGRKFFVATYLMDQFEMIKKDVPRNFDLQDYRITIEDLEHKAQIRFGQNLHQTEDLIV